MDKKYIPGIFNYCDKWCEQCPFTSRCRVYNQRNNAEPEQLYMQNEEFWEFISSTIKEGSDMLQKAAVERGVDLSDIPEEVMDLFTESQEEIEAVVEAHSLILLAQLHTKKATAFMEAVAGPEILNTENELVDQREMGVKSETDTMNAILKLRECEEKVQWYPFFIESKLRSALYGKIEAELGTTGKRFQVASDGFAKVAIISIERCIDAWTKLFRLMPACDYNASPVLSLLAQLKQKVLAEFPKAMQFKRPGFDDGESN